MHHNDMITYHAMQVNSNGKQSLINNIQNLNAFGRILLKTCCRMRDMHVSIKALFQC